VIDPDNAADLTGQDNVFVSTLVATIISTAGIVATATGIVTSASVVTSTGIRVLCGAVLARIGAPNLSRAAPECQ